MPLFLSGTAKEKNTSKPAVDIEELRAELARVKDRARITEKYGSGLTDEQIAEYLELEERAVRHKKEQQLETERRHADQERFQVEVPAAVTAAVKAGRLIVRVNGQRVREMPDIKANCSSCGGYLPRVYWELFRAGEMARAPPAKLSDVLSAGRGCYGDHPGMWYNGEKCTCGAETEIEIQYIFLA